ncbi:MAG: hypothetical protein MN733_11270 [Nitrososphaera sp.]|nr:hypothetical protein [Nitrososphaera sp.]
MDAFQRACKADSRGLFKIIKQCFFCYVVCPVSLLLFISCPVVYGAEIPKIEEDEASELILTRIEDFYVYVQHGRQRTEGHQRMADILERNGYLTIDKYLTEKGKQISINHASRPHAFGLLAGKRSIDKIVSIESEDGYNIVLFSYLLVPNDVGRLVGFTGGKFRGKAKFTYDPFG